MNQQIELILNDKIKSVWRRLQFKKCENFRSFKRYHCIKNADCECLYKVVIDHQTKIASIYWNETEHNHL